MHHDFAWPNKYETLNTLLYKVRVFSWILKGDWFVVFNLKTPVTRTRHFKYDLQAASANPVPLTGTAAPGFSITLVSVNNTCSSTAGTIPLREVCISV